MHNKKKGKVILLLKGFAMGIADIIPGVSGGTMALILGIYEELIDTISNYDQKMLNLLYKRDFKGLLKRMKLNFLFPLLIGILLAIFSSASLIHFLLNQHEKVTFAFFFGIIIFSIKLLYREFKLNFYSFIALGLGIVFAFLLVGFIPIETPRTLVLFFFSGIIGITAMILPGISGSFILLLLGKYNQIIAIIKEPFSGDNILYIIVFGLGAIIGLISFSKILKYFLNNHYDIIMALLTGLMIGSLRRIWPFSYSIDMNIIENLSSNLQAIFFAFIGLLFIYIINKLSEEKVDKT